MKIGLGTVQWGLNYGISNKRGIPSELELDKIFATASANGINLLDTATAYGEAESRIGNRSSGKFRIVTKIGSISKDNSIEQQVKKSLDNLKTTSLYGCLFHNVNELLETPSMWGEMQGQKKEGRIEKIGYSLYEPEELERLLDLNYIPDIIQVPYSILDRKFESYFELLKRHEVEIHVRSIFLQGLFFKPLSEVPTKLSSMIPALNQINEIAESAFLSKLQLALCFVLQNTNIDCAVIGIETYEQLDQIITSSSSSISENILQKIMRITLDNNVYLNPSNWK